MARINNQLRILEFALALLSEQGSHGLTMRKVAERSGISLGNLQYYYKDRDSLLMAMIDMYLNKCIAVIDAEFSQHLAAKATINFADLNRFIVNLIHNEELAEWCSIFREFWALSSRQDSIKQHLDHYYRQSAAKLSESLLSLTTDQQKIRRIEVLLIPFIEGYSITADALRATAEQAGYLVSSLIWAILQDDLAGDLEIGDAPVS